MNAAFNTALAAYGSGLITHIGLFNGSTEVTGGSPAYARIAVTWTGSGAVRSPSANLVFDVPSGAVVDNWRGFTALTGGTDYEGASLTSKTFSNQGTYTLLAASTNITIA